MFRNAITALVVNLFCLIITHQANAGEVACAAEPGATTLNYGDYSNCSISPAADSDGFIFSGSANDVVIVRTARTSVFTSFDPCFEVYEGFSLLASACTNDRSEAEFTLPSTGNYTITVMDGGNTDTGSYSIHLHQRSPSPAYATVMNYGDVVAGSINPSGELEVYTFTGVANDEVLVRASRTSVFTSFDPCFEVYDSSSVLVADACTSDRSEAVFTLPANDTYSIWVEDGQLDTGSFSLQLHQLSPAGAYLQEIVVNGPFESASVSVAGQLVGFKFMGLKGLPVTIFAERTSAFTSFDPCFRVYDDLGVEVISACTENSSLADVTLAKTGEFTILVEDGQLDTGSFRVSVSTAYMIPIPLWATIGLAVSFIVMFLSRSRANRRVS